MAQPSALNKSAILLDELAALSTRIHAELGQERELLAVEKQEFALSVSKAQEELVDHRWQISVERHRLVLDQQQWNERATVAKEVGAYQDRVVIIEADGGTLTTTEQTVCDGREPHSTLAELVQAQRRDSADPTDEPDEPPADDGAAASDERRIFIDRDAAALQ
eukprot:1035454-Prymnesium_polylepis.1